MHQIKVATEFACDFDSLIKDKRLSGINPTVMCHSVSRLDRGSCPPLLMRFCQRRRDDLFLSMFETNLAYPIKDNIIRQFSVLYGVSLDSPIWTRNARAPPSPPHTYTLRCYGQPSGIRARFRGENTPNIQSRNNGTTPPLSS